VGSPEPYAAAKRYLTAFPVGKSGWSILHFPGYNGPLDSAMDCRGQSMGFMDEWDLAVLAVAGYVAVVILVRLMVVERDRLLNRLRGELQQEIQKEKLADKKRKRQEQKAKEAKEAKEAKPAKVA
jgi:hypothetical protein